MNAIIVRSATEQDGSWIEDVIRGQWGSFEVVSRGRVHHAGRLPAFVAECDGERLGLLTYRLEEGACEVVTLNSLRERRGVGTALLKAVCDTAKKVGCKRVWLVTTNDNVEALRFYQKRGFHLVAVYPNAIERSREFKPQIPAVGRDGIPLRDEIELQIML